ncbi:MAG: ATP-binding protein [Clostridia bacterium]|nr:ATP-binding protein [Clostridia bacterium]
MEPLIDGNLRAKIYRLYDLFKRRGPSLKASPATQVSCPICLDRGIVYNGEQAHICRCMREQALRNRLKFCQPGYYFRNRTFADFDLAFYSRDYIDPDSGISYYQMAAATLKACQQFVETAANDPHARGLFLSGPVGSGKTFLAMCITNALIARGREVVFVVVPDLLDELRATYDRTDQNVSEIDLLDLCGNAEVLVLDDLGAHNYTEWTKNKIYSILNHRLNLLLPTVITSNLDLDQLEEYLGQRTTSRIIEMCLVYRLRVHEDIRYAKARRSRPSPGPG